MVVVKDPVCGMSFVEEDAAGKTEYKGKIYYFCAPSCKKSFESDPEKYLNMLNRSHTSPGGINNEGDEQNEKNNGVREHN